MKIPALWWIAASGAIANFVLYSLSTFLPAFLTRFHGLSVGQAGLWTGIGSGGAGILGCVAAGVYGDRIIGARHNGRLLLAAGASLGAAPLALGGHPAAGGQRRRLVHAAIKDIVPPSLRGTAMAVYFVAMYLCGASFGPLLTGRLSDHFAREAAGIRSGYGSRPCDWPYQAMYVIPALSVALPATLRAGTPRYGRSPTPWRLSGSMAPQSPPLRWPLPS